ncbi:MAG: hypothetical protein AB7F86_13260, partial [Bdellovibrionales bacterium]
MRNLQVGLMILTFSVAACGSKNFLSEPLGQGSDGGSPTTSNSNNTPPDTYSGPRPLGTRKCQTTSTQTENYSQPANSALPSGLTFLTDWAKYTRAGGWSSYQAMDACRLSYDPSFQTWHGLAVARVEVNPGDDPIGSGGERSEVLIPQSSTGKAIYENSASGRQFIAVSYFFPSNWDATWLNGNSESWSIIMQL